MDQNDERFRSPLLLSVSNCKVSHCGELPRPEAGLRAYFRSNLGGTLDAARLPALVRAAPDGLIVMV